MTCQIFYAPRNNFLSNGTSMKVAVIGPSNIERVAGAAGVSAALIREKAAEAGRRGWTVRRAKLHHLAMASDPDKVAALLADLP